MSEKTSVQLLKYNYTSQNSSQVGVEAPVEHSTSYELADSVQYGANIPNWRRVIAEGGNATTSLIGNRWTVTQSPAGYKARVESTTPPLGFLQTVVSGNLLVANGGLSFDLVPLAVANNRALTKFYKHLASEHSKFKGLVFSGELRETLNAIRHPGKALRNGIDFYLKALKKGSRLSRRDRPSFVRRTWLEYSFGWRPLIKDIDQAIDAFYQSQWVRPLFEMVSAYGTDEFVESPAYTVGLGADWILHYQLRNTANAYVKYRGVISMTGNGSVNGHSYGFSPWEFVPTVWELIPYSFLVDYFTNIGDIVSSWSYRFVRPNWASTTARLTLSSETVNMMPKEMLSYAAHRHKWTFSGTVGSVKLERVKVQRDRDANLELPSFEFQVPGMDARWVNIVALSANLSSARNSLRLKNPGNPRDGTLR